MNNSSFQSMIYKESLKKRKYMKFGEEKIYFVLMGKYISDQNFIMVY